MNEADKAEGLKLTLDILEVVAPLVEGKQSHVVIEALAAAMMATIAAAKIEDGDARMLLHRYAGRIMDFSDDIG